MNNDREFTEEEQKLAMRIAEVLTYLANAIMHSENPVAAMSVIVDCVGNGSEHIASCLSCDQSVQAEACGTDEETYRRVAIEMNIAICESIGADSPFLNSGNTPKHFH